MLRPLALTITMIAAASQADDQVFQLLRDVRETLAPGDQLLEAHVVDQGSWRVLNVEVLTADNKLSTRHFEIGSARELDRDEWRAILAEQEDDEFVGSDFEDDEFEDGEFDDDDFEEDEFEDSEFEDDFEDDFEDEWEDDDWEDDDWSDDSSNVAADDEQDDDLDDEDE
ncbi:hypothetical protein [Salinibius halmophilus]|uniref:hypothetical protein n=1 Tax=Salinibius halmophilus TaxID=1853216 RepID=UPI001314F10E|nr:hypothetical protein [Salinibius halmophilus]